MPPEQCWQQQFYSNFYCSSKKSQTNSREHSGICSDLFDRHLLKNVLLTASSNDVLSSRFYNFLKVTYNPTLKTLEGWLSSVDLELVTKKKNLGLGLGQSRFQIKSKKIKKNLKSSKSYSISMVNAKCLDTTFIFK